VKAFAGVLSGAVVLALAGGSDAVSRQSQCIALTQKQLRTQAQVIFDAVALRGPSYRGVLLSPARFRVLRYRKGHGDRNVRVQTEIRKSGGRVYAWVSEAIDPRAGERWRIYGRGARNGVVQTSDCSGSRRSAR